MRKGVKLNQFLLVLKKIDWPYFIICYLVKAKQSKANGQRHHQHHQYLHSSLGPMGGVHRYRVCGRDLCCFGFVAALSGGRRLFAFCYRGSHVGLRDVVLDDHVVPV